MLRKGRLIAAAVAATAIASAGLGVYGVPTSGASTEESALEQLTTEPTGPGRFARAYGVDAESGTYVFTLGTGVAVSVTADDRGKCLLGSVDGQKTESCSSAGGIAEGRAVWVFDECGSAGQNRMEITGLAPDGVSSARLIFSDSSHQSTSIVSGAFRFDGTNPGEDDPYPTGITWYDAEGHETGTATFPVEGNKFCLGTS